MPYICLARTDIPDGTVQILDLKPNTSQRSLIYEPPGQTRYVNRAQDDVAILSATGVTLGDSRGLRSYLLDRVEVGGTEVASAVVDLSVVAPGDQFIFVPGPPFPGPPVVFTGIPVPRAPGTLDFDASAPPAAQVELIAAIQDPVNEPIMLAASGGFRLDAAPGPGPFDVTVFAALAGPVPLPGPLGDALTIASTPGIVLSGPNLARATPLWTEVNLAAVSAALLARVDAGSTMTLADVDAVLATVGAELTGTGSNSTGVLTELLSILAGRGYLLPSGSVKLSGPTTWDPTQRGNFTENVVHFGTTWDAGEIVPVNIGGDTVAVETKPIRHTYDGTHFQVSLGTGHLATFQAGVTLFPDSDLVGHYPWLMQGNNQFPQANNARVVTVYNDDGTLA